MKMYSQIFSAFIAFTTFYCGYAHENNQSACIDFKNNSTWPDSVMADLEECYIEAKDDDMSTSQSSSGIRSRADITTKIKGFLQKLWSRFINTLQWREYKISILNCMWSNQKVFNVETKEVQWVKITDLIKGLKINDERQNKLLDALAECKANVQIDNKEPGGILKIFKCLFAHESTKLNCPFLSKKPWQKQEPHQA